MLSEGVQEVMVGEYLHTTLRKLGVILVLMRAETLVRCLHAIHRFPLRAVASLHANRKIPWRVGVSSHGTHKAPCRVAVASSHGNHKIDWRVGASSHEILLYSGHDCGESVSGQPHCLIHDVSHSLVSAKFAGITCHELTRSTAPL